MTNRIKHLLFLVNLLPIFLRAQPCSYLDHLENLVVPHRETYNGKAYLTKSYPVADGVSCFSKLPGSEPLFLDYLLTNYTTRGRFADLLATEDSVAFRREYYRLLRTDTAFVPLMQKLGDQMNRETGSKDTISEDQLVDVAVKFFSVLRITPQGHYMTKICVGTNDLQQTEAERMPFVEAFCFSTIFNAIKSGDSKINEDFIAIVKSLYQLNLGIDPSDRLLRAQGAVYVLMARQKSLRTLLREEYARNRDLLPFAVR